MSHCGLQDFDVFDGIYIRLEDPLVMGFINRIMVGKQAIESKINKDEMLSRANFIPEYDSGLCIRTKGNISKLEEFPLIAIIGYEL